MGFYSVRTNKKLGTAEGSETVLVRLGIIERPLLLLKLEKDEASRRCIKIHLRDGDISTPAHASSRARGARDWRWFAGISLH